MDSKFQICYICKIILTKEGEIQRNKWSIDYETPIFVLDRTFLTNIFTNGNDIFRSERDFLGKI